MGNKKHSACRSFFFAEKEFVNLPAGKAGLNISETKEDC
jgi:hypothetical protein